MTEREAQLRNELSGLIDADGRIYASDVIDWARDNRESELHRRFQWDERKAAYQHWLSTARHLIAAYIETERGERRMVSLSTDRINGGGYRDWTDVLDVAEMRRVAIADALAEVGRWRERNSHLIPELTQIFAAIDAALAPPPPAPRRGRPRRLPPPDERPAA